MNDLAARARRRLSRRRRWFLGRDSGFQSWFHQIRRFPVRYTLHLVAVLVGAGTLLWLPGQDEPRVAQQAAGSSTASAEVPTPPPVGEPTATIVEPAATPEERPAPFEYTIEPGDTVQGLAERFEVSIQTLLWNNNLPDPDVLRPGQVITVLPTSGVIHIVKLGETLRQVADQYEVSMEEIARHNAIDDPDRVAGGVELVIPGGQPLAAGVATGSGSGNDDSQMAALGEIRSLGDEDGSDESRAGPAATSRSIPQSVTYEVQPGDSLRLLTQMFGVDLETLLATNDIEDPDLITAGTKLRVLPVSGLEHEVQPGETLADIARQYRVDMGPILDFNDLADPDLIRVGMTLVIPGAKSTAAPPPPEEPAPAPAESAPAPAEPAPAPAEPAPAPAEPAPAPAEPAPAPAEPESTPPEPEPTPAEPAPAPAPPAPEAPAPPPAPSEASNAIAQTAMRYLGLPYVWGGTSPSGFDCSGFVFYVYRTNGKPIPRGMWGQLNSGPRIPATQLQPGDIVFFANTYQPGLSHNGIYLGGGQFIHASTPSTGVVISAMGTPYWSSRYIGATRP